MASEHSNSLVSLHSKLDSLIQVIETNDDFTVRNEELQEQFVQEIQDSDILLSLKKHFLLGHICLQKNQLQQGISHFQQSLRYQDELSYEDLKVLTLTSLFECFRLSQSKIHSFEYAYLLENEEKLPKRFRKRILTSIYEGYSFAGFVQKAIDTVNILLREELTLLERIFATINSLRLQFSFEDTSNSRLNSFEHLEALLKEALFDFEASASYLSLLFDLKEYNRLYLFASVINEYYTSKQLALGIFWYYELIGEVKSSDKKVTNEERSKIVQQCVHNKQYLFAILVNVFFLSESDNSLENSFKILESSVKLFDESIPTTVQVDVLERLVECCENKKEWKKGLYYFELYHNALQTIANENNTKTIESIQLKQFIATLNKHRNKLPLSVSSEILQRRNTLRHQQESDFELFLHSLKKYVQSGMHSPLEMFKKLPVKQYSAILAESVVAITRSMITTVETVIELHSLEEGAYSGTFETIPLSSIFEKLQTQLQLLTSRYECSIEIYVDRRIQWYGDVHLLTKSLFHILQNACKFSLKNSTIVLKASITTKELIITITDSGVGVTEEHKALVFSKYFEYDPLSTNSQSAGLGLPYCKKAISSMQGTIQLHSKVDVGTEVIVTLPITSSMAIPSPNMPTYSYTSTSIPLSETNGKLLSNLIGTKVDSSNLLEIISLVDDVSGSKEVNDWKRKLYVTIFYGEKEKVQTMLDQIK